MVLKEYIARICYVYIDDIIVFDKDEEEHLRNVDVKVDKVYFRKKKNEVHEN